jgi:hypothetical protein
MQTEGSEIKRGLHQCQHFGTEVKYDFEIGGKPNESMSGMTTELMTKEIRLNIKGIHICSDQFTSEFIHRVNCDSMNRFHAESFSMMEDRVKAF